MWWATSSWEKFALMDANGRATQFIKRTHLKQCRIGSAHLENWPFDHTMGEFHHFLLKSPSLHAVSTTSKLLIFLSAAEWRSAKFVWCTRQMRARTHTETSDSSHPFRWRSVWNSNLHRNRNKTTSQTQKQHINHLAKISRYSFKLAAISDARRDRRRQTRTMAWLVPIIAEHIRTRDALLLNSFQWFVIYEAAKHWHSA